MFYFFSFAFCNYLDMGFRCRPGFVRLNLAYFMSDEEVDFVIEAVKMVAVDGWKLLPR